MKFLLLLLPLYSFSQNAIPEKANAIKVTGIAFREIANNALDAGFVFDKVDSNFQTIKTEFRNGKNKSMKLRLMIRVKDSVAIISGEWYDASSIGRTVAGVEHTIENSTMKIKYTSGHSKRCFEDMDKFAQSLNRPVEYIVVK